MLTFSPFALSFIFPSLSGNAGHAESGSAQGGHGGETVHNHEPSHKKAAQSTEKKIQKAFEERDGLVANASHSPDSDAYDLTARDEEPPASSTTTPPPPSSGNDEGKDMDFSAHHDHSGEGLQIARRSISYEHQHDPSISKDDYSLNAAKDSASSMDSRSLGIKGDRKTTSLDGKDKKSGSEQDTQLDYGKRENDEYMALLEEREGYSSEVEEMDHDLLGDKMATRSNHASNSGSGNNKNGRITIANAGNG